MFPFHSIQRGPGENQRQYVCLLTGASYPYSKGSSTDGVDAKAAAFEALRAAQVARVTELQESGRLAIRPIEKYTVEELRSVA